MQADCSTEELPGLLHPLQPMMQEAEGFRRWSINGLSPDSAMEGMQTGLHWLRARPRKCCVLRRQASTGG